MVDRSVWDKEPSGIFSCKSLYSLLKPNPPTNFSLKPVWKSAAPSEVGVKLGLGFNPTLMTRPKKSMGLDNVFVYFGSGQVGKIKTLKKFGLG